MQQRDAAQKAAREAQRSGTPPGGPQVSVCFTLLLPLFLTKHQSHQSRKLDSLAVRCLDETCVYHKKQVILV